MYLSRSKNSLLYAGFNSDSTYFCIGTTSGFRVYSMEPDLILNRDYQPTVKAPGLLLAPGGISCLQVLEKSNLFALVAGGKHPKFDPNTLILWDDNQRAIVSKLEFSVPVKGIRLTTNWMIVMFLSRVLIYNIFPSPVLVHTFETYSNENPINDVVGTPDSCMIAICSRSRGQVQIIEIGQKTPFTNVIAAHSSKIACISLSPSGKSVATASKKGTLIRVFDTRTGKLLHELRRGADTARIYSIAFDATGSRLCVSSDKGTIHVFGLDQPAQSKQSIISPFTPFLPKYFSSDWSVASMTVPTLCRSVISFAKNDSSKIICLTADGALFQYRYQMDRGPKQEGLESYVRFLDIAE